MDAFVATLAAVMVATIAVLPVSVVAAHRGHRLRTRAADALGIEGKERQPVMAIELVAAAVALLALVVVGALSEGDIRIGVWSLALLLPWLLLQLGAVPTGAFSDGGR